MLSNILFGCIKETSKGDISFTHPKHYASKDSKLLKYIMNRSYSLNQVTPKFISN